MFNPHWFEQHPFGLPFAAWLFTQSLHPFLPLTRGCGGFFWATNTKPSQVFLVLSLLLLLGITTHDLAMLSLVKQECLAT